ncbi:MAG TPA: hypothetical protein VF163_00395 [Micromonosporaceae bacterium]
MRIATPAIAVLADGPGRPPATVVAGWLVHAVNPIATNITVYAAQPRLIEPHIHDRIGPIVSRPVGTWLAVGPIHHQPETKP